MAINLNRKVYRMFPERYPPHRLRTLGHVQKYLRQPGNSKPDKCEICHKPRHLDGHHIGKSLIFIFICRSCHMKIHCGTLVLLPSAIKEIGRKFPYKLRIIPADGKVK
jgi:hypothetical protein